MIRLLSKREKVILYATVGVIIFVAVFNFLISPILTKNDNLNKEINFNQQKLKKYLWLLNQKEAIQSKHSKFVTITGISGQQEDALVGVLSELENLAKNANIRIIDLIPQQVTPRANLYKESLITLRTEGTIEGYLKFIYNLENSLSLLRIKKFQLSTKPNTPSLEGSFSISRLSLD